MMRKNKGRNRMRILPPLLHFYVVGASTLNDRTDGGEKLVVSIIDIVVSEEPGDVVILSCHKTIERHGNVQDGLPHRDSDLVDCELRPEGEAVGCSALSGGIGATPAPRRAYWRHEREPKNQPASVVWTACCRCA